MSEEQVVHTGSGSVESYMGASLAGFSPAGTVSGLRSGAGQSGVSVNAGIMVDREVALEVGWTGTANEGQEFVQAGTLDAKVFLASEGLRPYLSAGAGIYGVQHDGPGTKALVGPGVQVGGGFELGDGPLSVGVGVTWHAASLSPLDEAGPEQLMTGLGAKLGVTVRF